MRKHLPNCLTMLRLIFAIAFFITLNLYHYPHGRAWALWSAIALFIIAALTDALDGHLARSWKVESTFGRIMDPVVDKVLVIGAFIYLAGPRFVIGDPENCRLVSGVYPWMVIVILAREMLVTSVRALLEADGHQFPALKLGKWKMILQSIVIPIILAIIWLDPARDDRLWLGLVRDGLVYLTVLVTLVSGLPYLARAFTLMRPPT